MLDFKNLGDPSTRNQRTVYINRVILFRAGELSINLRVPTVIYRQKGEGGDDVKYYVIFMLCYDTSCNYYSANSIMGRSTPGLRA